MSKKQIQKQRLRHIKAEDMGKELMEGRAGDEIVVHWVNTYGVPMDIKTRRGGLIHALWLAEHEKRAGVETKGSLRNRRGAEAKKAEQPAIIDITTEVVELPKALGAGTTKTTEAVDKH